MTEPTTPFASIPGTVDYLATVEGIWNPVTMPAITGDNFPVIQHAATTALRELLGISDNSIDFHLIANKGPGTRVYRSRWRVEAHGSGPTLLVGQAGAHPSQVGLMLRVYPLSQVRQFVADEDWNEMPQMGVMGAIVPAILLCHHLLKPDGWGVQPIPVAAGTLGMGNFTPHTLVYRDLFDAPVDGHDAGRNFRIPLVDGDGNPTDIRTVVSYCYDSVRARVHRPIPFGMWLVADGPDNKSWKISYCVDQVEQGPSQRWDLDPEHPEWDSAPGFTPLPWPAAVSAAISLADLSEALEG